MVTRAPQPSPAPLPVVLLALLALVSLAALALLAPGAGASVDFEEVPTPISRVIDGTQTSVDLATGPSDLLYAVWQDGRLTPYQAGTAVFFAVSDVDDRGRAWGDALRIPASSDRADQALPAISVGPDGVIHLVWQERPRSDDSPEGPYWEVRYTRSRDGGDTWSDPLRVSPPNNRHNFAPDVAAIAGDSAYVAWEMDDHPGTSIPLALVVRGSRAWVREDFWEASERWRLNGQVCLDTDTDGGLHVAWASMDVDAMWDVRASQVFYRSIDDVSSTSVLAEAIPLVDEPSNRTNTAPSVAVTKRHGAWVVWVQEDEDTALTDPRSVAFLADRVVNGEASVDIVVARLTAVAGAEPLVAATAGESGEVHVAMSGVGDPGSPPVFTLSCSEHGCFAAPRTVVPQGTTEGVNATVATDSLGNVYVGWDDGEDVWCTQRRNSPPGPPELVHPDGYTHDATPEFVWAFNDPDAGSSQNAFMIEYSLDPTFLEGVLGGVVMGVQGRSSRYVAPEPIEEWRWHWRVRTRDQLGLWSDWSPVGDFLADRTPPTGTVVVNDGAEFTHQRVVVLLLNATDNLEEIADGMYFQISSDPNFMSAPKHEWPPANHQVNQDLPPGEGVKVVFFRIFDASNLYFTTIDTITYNETPFIIAHTPVATAPSGKDLNISCEIMRAKGVTATLFYRRTGDDGYKEVEMEVNGTLYWADIPKKTMTVKGVEYYIRARSTTGTVTFPVSSPVESPIVVEVYETTDDYKPPLFYPTITFLGAMVVLVMLFSVWYFRIRESS